MNTQGVREYLLDLQAHIIDTLQRAEGRDFITEYQSRTDGYSSQGTSPT